MTRRTRLIYWLVLAFLVLACIRCGQAHAGEWTTEDKVEETIYQTANFVDLMQTVYIARHPDKFAESESAYIIGTHPDSATVYGYMAASGIVHAIGTELLIQMEAPRWVKRTWQGVTIGDKVNCIRRGISIGIKYEF